MDQGNKPKIGIEFELEDIGVMWHALRLQSATDMMYGKEGAKSRKRTKSLADDLERRYPLICNHGIEEYGWLNAILAVKTAKEVSISQKAELDWDHYRQTDYTERRASKDRMYTHPITVMADGVSYAISGRDIPYSKECLKAFRELLQEIVPLDCKLHEILEQDLD